MRRLPYISPRRPEIGAEIAAALSDASAAGLSQLLMIGQDFPMEWAAFTGGTGDLALVLRRGDFPYFIRNRGIVLDDITLFASGADRLLRRDLLSRGKAADAPRLDALSDALTVSGEIRLDASEAAQIQEALVDAVNLHVGREPVQDGHHPAAHVAV